MRGGAGSSVTIAPGGAFPTTTGGPDTGATAGDDAVEELPPVWFDEHADNVSAAIKRRRTRPFPIPPCYRLLVPSLVEGPALSSRGRTVEYERLSRHLAVVALVFVAMTILMTAPFSWQFTDHLIPNIDSYLHVWMLAWIAHQLAVDPAHLFNANIFYPAANTLSFADAFPLLGLVGSPFIWAGIHPVAVHNGLILMSFVASGMGMFVLAFELTTAVVPSIVAGAIFTFASQRFGHFGHVELLWNCWMPLAMWSLYRLMRDGKLRDGVLLGLFVALQGLSSLYNFVLLATYLAVTGLALIDRAPLDLWKRRAAALALAAVTATVLVGPYLVAYSQMRTGHRSRTEAEIARYSASVQTYARVNPENRLYFFLRRTVDAHERSLFPGALALALAAGGIWKNRRREIGVLVVGMIFAFWMSLGLNGWLYPHFSSLAPPLQDVRAPARYGTLVLMSLAALAAVGASRLLRSQTHRRTLVSAVLLAILCVEYASMPIATSRAVLEPPQMAQWLARKPKGSVTVMLPMHFVRHDPFYEFLSIYHWQPLVNGYSGFNPPDYRATVESLQTLPDAASVQLLKTRNVSYVVLSARGYGEPYYSELRQTLRGHPDFVVAETFDDLVFPCTIFALRR